MGRIEQAADCFNQGANMGKRYFGSSHSLTLKFLHKLNSPSMVGFPVIENGTRQSRRETQLCDTERQKSLENTMSARSSKCFGTKQLQEEQKTKDLEELRRLMYKSNQTRREDTTKFIDNLPRSVKTTLEENYTETTKGRFINQSVNEGEIIMRPESRNEQQLESILAEQKNEQEKRLKEIEERAHKEIKKVKEEKERAIAELREANEMQLKEMEAKIMVKLQQIEEASKNSFINSKSNLEAKIDTSSSSHRVSTRNEKSLSTNGVSKTKDKLKQNEKKELVYCRILDNIDHKYKVSIHGKYNSNEDIVIEVNITCLNNKDIIIQKEVLDTKKIKEILSSVAINDVIPKRLTLRSLADIMKYGVLPFIQVSKDQVDIWIHPTGIIKDYNLQIAFLETVCHMDLNYIEKRQMRIVLSPIDVESSNSFYIDLDYDELTFDSQFPLIDSKIYKQTPNEVWLPTFAPVPVDFVDTFDKAFTQIESYFEERDKKSFREVVEDNSLKGVLITIRDNKQILWILRDKETHFEIHCETLYEIESKFY